MAQFSSTNQPAEKKGRGTGWRTLIIEGLKAQGMTEQQFVNKAIERAVNVEDRQSGLLLKELISRLSPIHKASAEPVKFDYPENGTDTEKIDAIIKATSSGDIPADIAKTVVDMLSTRLDVLERGELVKRLEALEALLDGKKANI